jgi:diguanylate cyclase (GGDEF)-like protein
MRADDTALPTVTTREPALAQVAQGPRTFVRGLRFVAFGVLALYAIVSVFGLGRGIISAAVPHWISALLLGAGAFLCLARATLVGQQRAAWSIVGVGLLSWAAGETLIALLGSSAGGGFTLADALSLGFYPAACVSLVLLLRAHLGEFFTTLWLDGLAGALSVSALAAAFVFPPVLASYHGAKLSHLLGSLSYPLCDLLLIAFVVFALAMTGWRPGRFLGLIAGAFILVAITDAFSLWWTSTGHSAETMQWSWLWQAAALLLGEVAWRVSTPAPAVNHTSLRLLVVPIGFSLTALLLLMSGLMRDLDTAGYELAVSALLLIVVRLALTVLDNLQIAEDSRREALTDALTGLGNRRKLMRDVEESVQREGTTTGLALFDLDGFKLYNDTFGHPAGDSLLARLGRALEQVSEDWGNAYRLGGDEFCILVRTDDADLDAAIEQASAALSEHGSGFSVTPSNGSVTMPDETDDTTVAFQMADQRLYLQKGTRRRSRDSEQVRDVLIQALREKQPDLDEHLGGVATLAQAVGRRLGLHAEGIDEVTRAAELHDIGKMAVPDAILEKPADLDDEERSLIRQHTVIGERILAVSPAMRSVGTLVRHSHERYDGHGYPDKLAGEEIPLGARIIAVCDAFDAMTTNRAYQDAVPFDDALDELRRCAGGQFDPAVVEAFCREARTGAPDEISLRANRSHAREVSVRSEPASS